MSLIFSPELVHTTLSAYRFTLTSDLYSSIMAETGQGRWDPGAPPRLKTLEQIIKKKIDDNTTAKLDGNPRREASHDLPILPPGVSRSKFNTAIDELQKAIGAENVELNDKPLVDGWYLSQPKTHDGFHVLDQDDLVASAVVAPADTKETQIIVKWANKHKIPIFPISIGRNLGYGGAAPRVRGSVVVDMGKRMNRVLEIDEDSCTCLIEPGVTFFGLYEAVQKQGAKLWVDVPDLGGGSVIGNTVDRGVGYTPYGDHFGMHCGFEVVLPNGEVIRTGMGAMPGQNTSHGSSNTWQLFPYGFGPYPDGLFTQSNLGIVTKMGLWLMPEPEGAQVFLFTFPREEDLETLVDIIRPLRIQQVIANFPHLRHVLQEAAVYGNKASYYTGPGAVPDNMIDEISSKLWMGKCRWLYYGCVYGNEEFRNAQLNAIKKAFFKIPGTKFFLPEDSPDYSYLRSRVNIYCGKPDLRELEWVNWMPNGAHLFFAPISPVTGKDARAQFQLCKKRCDQYGLDFLSTYVVGMREMHHIASIIYDRGDPDCKRRAHALLRDLVADAAKVGYGEYRTHLIMQDQVMNTYNWNNNAFLKFNETLKDALDPNGIMSPGRCGVWPKSYRGKGWEMARVDDKSTGNDDAKASL